MQKILSTCCFLLLLTVGVSQEIKIMSSGEIQHALKKLNTLGSVLYIAAHPDDENTRLISYMANERLVRTAYLSLTRGDGGQNLIGKEQGKYMGVLRTQELMEARKVDGGEQYFTRAVDFGYSKTPEETFAIWDKKEILSDVVWVIRKFKPDLIITRFPPSTQAGHGHHTASAILAEEAFDLAADPNAFPEQLKYVQVWQAKRLYFNASTWWMKDLEAHADTSSDYVTVDVGKYNKLLGKWYTEIAAESRSKHKSQGFGTAGVRGSQIEYLKYVKGEKAENDILHAIDASWNRVDNGKKISKMGNKIVSSFDAENPEKSIAQLLKMYDEIEKLPDAVHWKKLKQEEIKKIILSCAGMHIDAYTDVASATPGSNVKVTVAIVNRSKFPISVNKIVYYNKTVDTKTLVLANKLYTNSQEVYIPIDKEVTNPFWLNAGYEGIFEVKDLMLVAEPQNPAALTATFGIEYSGKLMEFEIPIKYKWTDRVEGEKRKAFIVIPDAVISVPEKLIVFTSNQSKKIKISVKANKAFENGVLKLDLPSDWKISPAEYIFTMNKANEVKEFEFEITPAQKNQRIEVLAYVDIKGRRFDISEVNIKYPHVEEQTLFPKASMILLKEDIKNKVKKVAYIMGAGDDVPAAIRQLNIELELLDATKLAVNNLQEYDAIITGVRAYNTEEYLKSLHYRLLDYVNKGGVLLVQYNTNRDLLIQDIGPYPIKFGRGRVTDENSPVFFESENSAVLKGLNTITPDDFTNWVQERGIYFADEWDAKYQSPIAWNDQGEETQSGALLLTQYGQGYFVYTGIAFFRQLPAGVPGAFKLFFNLLNLPYATNFNDGKTGVKPN
jgi:LmbE family N-acetylglucosaminyl deacetylase